MKNPFFLENVVQIISNINIAFSNCLQTFACKQDMKCAIFSPKIMFSLESDHICQFKKICHPKISEQAHLKVDGLQSAVWSFTYWSLLSFCLMLLWLHPVCEPAYNK